MKLYDFTVEKGNYFSISLVEQNKPDFTLHIYHRTPGSLSLKCIYTQFLSADIYYNLHISYLCRIPDDYKRKFEILNFLKSYIDLDKYSNQNIEIRYETIFDRLIDHNEYYYFNVIIINLKDELFQHLINESSMSYIHKLNDSLKSETSTFYIKDCDEFDRCINKEEFISYLKVLYRKKYER